MNDQTLNQSRLKELLHYDPDTGVFTWLVSPSNRVPAGGVAGGMNHTGYWRIQVAGKRYGAHRLAWLYMTGEFPPDEIDHRNLDRADNRWDNLRLATHAQNQQNGKPWGASKHKGVSWHRASGRWRAQATLNRKTHYLGLHDSEQDAAAAYAAFANQHFPQFARL